MVRRIVKNLFCASSKPQNIYVPAQTAFPYYIRFDKRVLQAKPF
jgi:hypothetical protein